MTTNNNDGFWKTEFTAPFHLIATLDEVLESLFSEFSWHAVLEDNERGDMPEMDEPWRMQAYSQEKPDLAKLEAILEVVKHTQDVEISAASSSYHQHKNWLLDNQQQFAPLHIGSFYIHGREDTKEPKADQIPIIMDASMAFGTGQHATTKNCLLQLEALKNSGVSVCRALDMGAGSGILSFAIAQLWQNSSVFAVDMDEQSIITAKQYAEYNHVDNQVTIMLGQGYQVPFIQQQAPYDLIVSNIFSGPLIEMASDLTQHLKQGGYAILSGFLSHDAARVQMAHEDYGLRCVATVEDDNWITLVLHKEA